MKDLFKIYKDFHRDKKQQYDFTKFAEFIQVELASPFQAIIPLLALEQLIDEQGISFDQALKIVQSVFINKIEK